MTGEVWLDFCEESELEEAGFDNGADMFVHFKVTVEDYTKVFGRGANVGDEGVRGVVGGDSVVVE